MTKLEKMFDFPRNIPDDIITVFDVCDESDAEFIKKTYFFSNKTDYIANKKQHRKWRPIESIYYDLQRYYKYKGNKDKAVFWENKISEYYFLKS